MGCGCGNVRSLGMPCECGYVVNAYGLQERCSPTSVSEYIGTTLNFTESWQVPAVNGSVAVKVAKVANVLVGGYVWNPIYGFYQVTAFNFSTQTLTLLNNGVAGNPTPGSLVPAYTLFNLTSPPVPTILEATDWDPSLWTCSGSMTFTPSTVAGLYWEEGDRISFTLSVTGDVGGVASNTIYYSLPKAMDTNYASTFYTTAGSDVPMTGYTDPASKGVLRKEDASNFTSPSTITLTTSGFYKKAA